MYAHSVIENRMIALAIDKIIERTTLAPDYSEEMFCNISSIMGDLHEYLNELGYLQRLDFAKASGAIRGELYAKVKELNNIRNALSHTKDKKYQIYLNNQKHLEALQLICWLLDQTRDTMPFFEALDAYVKNSENDDIPF